jgi:hypothetical protein
MRRGTASWTAIVAALVLGSNPCRAALDFSDDFSGAAIDSYWWTVTAVDGNTAMLDTVTQRFEMTQGSTNGSAGLAFNFPLQGDFDVHVDFILNDWTMTPAGYEQERVAIYSSAVRSSGSATGTSEVRSI